LPEALQKDAELYAGCVSGAIQKEEYLNLIKMNGFNNIIIQKEKPITLPDDILNQYLNEVQLAEFRAGTTGIFSITVYAEKIKSCCGTDCCN
ncbi:MAG TPA: arsenite S-adenosylmethyltransferase, partial [Cytophagales bacterium]|nr:arsenite S-adenosylmethyltransferase [Cytophagales bacterium]